MKSLLIAMLVLVPLYAFAQDAKMPADAKKVIDKYEASVEASRKAFDASVAKARDQAIKDLKPIQTAETKKGNLDGAMLVKNKVEELAAEIPKPAAEGDLANPTPPVNSDPRTATLIGKWKLISSGGSIVGIWEIKENGIIERPSYVGKYAIEKDKVIITWTNEIDTMKMPKRGVMEGTASQGHSVRLEKVEENK